MYLPGLKGLHHGERGGYLFSKGEKHIQIFEIKINIKEIEHLFQSV